MSTLNVANISDDQSTLTGANENPTDKLHFNKTVDTKFVTNGCAKAYARYRADTTGGATTLNISSFSSNGLGDGDMNFTSSFSSSAIVGCGTGDSNSSRSVNVRNISPSKMNIRFWKTSDVTSTSHADGLTDSGSVMTQFDGDLA